MTFPVEPIVASTSTTIHTDSIDVCLRSQSCHLAATILAALALSARGGGGESSGGTPDPGDFDDDRPNDGQQDPDSGLSEQPQVVVTTPFTASPFRIERVFTLDAPSIGSDRVDLVGIATHLTDAVQCSVTPVMGSFQLSDGTTAGTRGRFTASDGILPGTSAFFFLQDLA